MSVPKMNLTRFLIFNFGPVIQPGPKVNPSLLVIQVPRLTLHCWPFQTVRLTLWLLLMPAVLLEPYSRVASPGTFPMGQLPDHISETSRIARQAKYGEAAPAPGAAKSHCLTANGTVL